MYKLHLRSTVRSSRKLGFLKGYVCCAYGTPWDGGHVRVQVLLVVLSSYYDIAGSYLHQPKAFSMRYSRFFLFASAGEHCTQMLYKEGRETYTRTNNGWDVRRMMSDLVHTFNVTVLLTDLHRVSRRDQSSRRIRDWHFVIPTLFSRLHCVARPHLWFNLDRFARGFDSLASCSNP